LPYIIVRSSKLIEKANKRLDNSPVSGRTIFRLEVSIYAHASPPLARKGGRDWRERKGMTGIGIYFWMEEKALVDFL
jgi:hypothetical protein